MNTRHICVLALSLIALFPRADAQIYKYVDPVTGAVEYTNQPRKGAKAMNLDGTLSEIPTGNNNRTVGGAKSKEPRAVNVSSGVNNNAGKPEAAVDASLQKTRDGTRSRILADELASEEKALAELRVQMNNGKPLPLADETVGSAKYIDRVKQIEKAQRHHERNIAALKKEIELARL
jgi:Domain of unknown function (DUF4124)